MKWAKFLVALVLSIPSLAQLQTPRAGDSVSIRGVIDGLNSSSNCSAELRSAFSGFVVQRTVCSQTGFDFTDIPRGTYLVVVEVGMSEITQQVEADMPSTEVHIQAQQNNPPTVARRSSTVSVAELMVPEKAKSLFNKATNLMQQSKFDKAQENLKKALTIAPQYARALALEAVICAQNKDLSSAMKNADNAVASDAQLPFAQFVRAMVLNATGRFQEASVAANHGLSIDNTAWQGHFELAHAMYGMGNLSSAMNEINRAEGAAPKNFPDVYLLKAMILIKANLLQQAKQVLNGLQKDSEHDPRVQQLSTLLASRLAQK